MEMDCDSEAIDREEKCKWQLSKEKVLYRKSFRTYNTSCNLASGFYNESEVHERDKKILDLEMPLIVTLTLTPINLSLFT